MTVLPDDDDLIYMYGQGRGEYRLSIGELGATRWNVIVDEAGDRLTNWTTLGGSWSSGPGYFTQTNTANAYSGLVYKPPLFFHGATATQADIRFPASSSTLRRGLLGPAGAGIVNGTFDPWVGLQEGTVEGVTVCGGDAAVNVSPLSVAEDRWYTVRTAQSGQIVSVAVDNTWHQCIRVNQAEKTMSAANKLTLVCFGGPVWFRNVKLWRIEGPVW